MRFKIVLLVAAVLVAGLVRDVSARPAVVADLVNLRSGPGTNFSSILEIPPRALVDAGKCRSDWCRVSYAGADGYIAAAALRFVDAVTKRADAPMLLPLGARVWTSDEPPLFDPYTSGGPWYTGPWQYEGTRAVQWRYGFPGGHVEWFRGLGWRPGFGWF